ncbi:MAG: halocyanin domain-containing protein [Halobacteriota archaeon]
MDGHTTRRRLLATAGAGLLALAGCTGEDGGSGEDLESDVYGDWFEHASAYEGTEDRTGEDAVTVRVGSGDNGLGFSPAAVRVSVGTTVVFEWTGRGGVHNVVEENEAFASPNEAAEGATFEHTFADVGVYRYECTPHEHLGMVGAVDVVAE